MANISKIQVGSHNYDIRDKFAAEKSVATTISDGLMSATDKKNLDSLLPLKNIATTSRNGLMSATDKKNLDSLTPWKNAFIEVKNIEYVDQVDRCWFYNQDLAGRCTVGAKVIINGNDGDPIELRDDLGVELSGENVAGYNFEYASSDNSMCLSSISKPLPLVSIRIDLPNYPGKTYYFLLT